MARGSLGHLHCSPPPLMAGAGGRAVPKTLGAQPVAGAGVRAALSGRQTPSPHPARGRGIGAQPLHLAGRKDRTPTRDTPLPGGAHPKPAQGAPQAPSPGNPSAPPPSPKGPRHLPAAPGHGRAPAAEHTASRSGSGAGRNRGARSALARPPLALPDRHQSPPVATSPLQSSPVPPWPGWGAAGGCEAGVPGVQELPGLR